MPRPVRPPAPFGRTGPVCGLRSAVILGLCGAIVLDETGSEFPQDPYQQLDLAIKAVFASWFGKRARDYRDNQKIPHDLGTAVNVMMMVFGNMGEDSGTGVAFSRSYARTEMRDL